MKTLLLRQPMTRKFFFDFGRSYNELLYEGDTLASITGNDSFGVALGVTVQSGANGGAAPTVGTPSINAVPTLMPESDGYVAPTATAVLVVIGRPAPGDNFKAFCTALTAGGSTLTLEGVLTSNT